MTTHRPYQRAMTFTEAVELLNKLKLSTFDERVIEAFNRAYRKGLIAPEAQLDEPANADLTEVVSA